MPKTKWVKYSLMMVVLVGYAFLAGCGTKGPLYIPEQRYPQPGQKDAPKKVPHNNTNSSNTSQPY